MGKPWENLGKTVDHWHLTMRQVAGNHDSGTLLRNDRKQCWKIVI